MCQPSSSWGRVALRFPCPHLPSAIGSTSKRFAYRIEAIPLLKTQNIILSVLLIIAFGITLSALIVYYNKYYKQSVRALSLDSCFVDTQIDDDNQLVFEEAPYIGSASINPENADDLTLINRSDTLLPATVFTSVAFNNDASLLALEADIHLRGIINTYTGEVIWSNELARGVGGLAFTEDNELLGLGYSEVFYFEDNDTLFNYSLGNNIIDTSLASNGNCVAVGATDGSIRFATIDTMDDQIGSINAPNDIANVTFSNDGIWLAYSTSGDWDSGGPAVFSLWNLQHNTEVLRTRLETGNWREADIVFNANSQLLAVSYYDRINLYNTASEELIFILDDIGARRDRNISQLAFNINGSLLASGTHDGDISLWDTETGEMIANYQINSAVLDLAFNQDSRNLLVIGEMGSLWYWGIE